MIFSRIKQKKYFNKLLLRRPVYICLLLLFFSIASIIAEQVQMRILEKLENRLYKDQITPSNQELLFIVSSVERSDNEIDVFVTIAEPDCSKPADEISYSPVDTKKAIRTNEFCGEIELTRGYRHKGAIDLYNLRSSEFILSDFAKNLETEPVGDLGLTPEEMLGLKTLLTTLTNGYEPERSQSVQSNIK